MHRDMETSDLIGEYEAAARLHEEAFRLGNIKVSNEAALRVAQVYSELRERGARGALLSLLRSSDRGVRGWAASHALDFSPQAGLPILEALTTETGHVGLSARSTLSVWRQGGLRFP